jgi:hypothetical protein
VIDLATALQSVEQTGKGPRCSVGLLLDELDDVSRAALIAAMGNPRKMGTEILEALVLAGITNVPVTSINRHRVLPGSPRKCACRD